MNFSDKSDGKTDLAKISLKKYSVELKNSRDASVSSVKIIEQK